MIMDEFIWINLNP